MTSKLKDLYLDLVEVLIMANVAFWDTDLNGPAVVIAVRSLKAKYVVIVGGNKTWKRRVFVLAHEIGHIFHISRGKKNGLELRRRIGSEKQANLTACKILDVLDPKLKKEFAKMYNTLNKGSRRKKFELPK